MSSRTDLLFVDPIQGPVPNPAPRSTNFFLGQGNQLPVLTGQLLQVDGSGRRCPFDLTGWTVTFRMMGGGRCGGVLIGTLGTVTVLVARAGTFTYAWATNDSATPGTYRATATATKGGLSIDFPNDDYATVMVRPAVGR